MLGLLYFMFWDGYARGTRFAVLCDKKLDVQQYPAWMQELSKTGADK